MVYLIGQSDTLMVHGSSVQQLLLHWMVMSTELWSPWKQLAGSGDLAA